MNGCSNVFCKVGSITAVIILITRGQSDLAKAAPNDTLHVPPNDRLTDHRLQ